MDREHPSSFYLRHERRRAMDESGVALHERIRPAGTG